MVDHNIIQSEETTPVRNNNNNNGKDLNAIIFESDNGPVSALFINEEMSTSPTNAKILAGGDMDEHCTNNNEKQRTVTFDSAVEEKEVHDTSKQVLMDKLYKVQAELISEKSIRKRKEKSLVKLAKELNNRSTDMEKKDKHIIELEETIEDLENRLNSRNHDLVIQLPRLKSTCKQQEIAILEYEETVQKLQKQVQESKNETDRIKEELISVLTKQVEQQATTQKDDDYMMLTPTNSPRSVTRNVVSPKKKQEMREELFSTPLSKSKTTKAPTPLSYPPLGSSSNSSTNTAAASTTLIDGESINNDNKSSIKNDNTWTLSWLGFIGVALLALVIAIPNGALSSNSICSPIRPGTTITTTSSEHHGIYQAPWWVPDTPNTGMKSTIFNTICVGRKPTSLHVDTNGKVEVFKENVSVWSGKGATSTTFYADKLIQRTKRGVETTIVSPWADNQY